MDECPAHISFPNEGSVYLSALWASRCPCTHKAGTQLDGQVGPDSGFGGMSAQQASFSLTVFGTAKLAQSNCCAHSHGNIVRLVAEEKGHAPPIIVGMWQISGQNIAKPQQCGGTGLLSLPENVIANISANLPTASNCRQQLVCRTFRDILSQPAPGVWGVIDLEDPCFSRAKMRDLTA